MTRTRGLLDRGLHGAGGGGEGHTSQQAPCWPGLPGAAGKVTDGAHLSSMLPPGEAKGLLGTSSVMSEMMGPEVETASGE